MKNYSFYKIQEWQEFYLDYYSLKTFLSFIYNKKKNLNSPESKKKEKRFSVIGVSPLIKSKEPNYLPSEEIELNPQTKKRNSLQIVRRGSTINYNNNDEINLNNFDNLVKLQKHISKDSNNNNKDEQNSIYLEEKNSITTEKKSEIINRIDLLHGLPETLKLDQFLKFYYEKIKVLDNFFTSQINSNEKKCLNIQLKLNISKKGKNDESEDSSNDSGSQLDYHERDELDYATSLKRALSNMYNFCSWLHSFHSINLLAIKKIQLKTNKVFKKYKINDVDERFKKINDKIEFFQNLTKVISLRKKIQQMYAEGLTNGDLIQAKKELEERLKGSSQVNQKQIICFYIGMLMIELLFYIFLSINDKQKKNSVKPFFPAFNFSLCIILTFFGVAVNLEILYRYKINYLYIFEVEPRMRIGSWEVLETTLCMLTIWCFFMLCAKITYNYSLFGNIYYLSPLISTSSLLLFLFLPFNYFYYHFRMGIIRIFFGNVFPIGKKGVRFRDFLFGDILTSLSKPICSLALAICLFSCDDCRKNNQRISKCNRDTIYCLLIQIYFPLIRAMQCANRYYYTRDLWPHLANLSKYIINIVNVYLSWNYSQNKNHFNHELYIVFGLFATTFQYGWDVYVDWGIGRPESKIFLLRDKIVYPKQFYYCAMILNGVIRFSWLLGFIELNKNKFDEWKNLFLSLIEIYRRIQWCIIRIENENTTNPEKYRTILDIPELPDI